MYSSSSASPIDDVSIYIYLDGNLIPGPAGAPGGTALCSLQGDETEQWQRLCPEARPPLFLDMVAISFNCIRT